VRDEHPVPGEPEAGTLAQEEALLDKRCQIRAISLPDIDAVALTECHDINTVGKPEGREKGVTQPLAGREPV
jgi:predicted nuclease with RNAse H fold